MGSGTGALKTAAARLGISVDEYTKRIAQDEKWCGGCRNWHPRSAFAVDRSRSDGCVKWCREYANNQARKTYEPTPRPSPGRRFVAARDGDQLQARGRVNHLITVGLLPAPNALPCCDCGHVYKPGERRHEYDHHNGYQAEHHEDVEAVCTTCHHSREMNRRSA